MKFWEALKSKYDSNDTGLRNMLVLFGYHFKMIDDKLVLEQIYEYENLCAKTLAEGMTICDSFQANCLLDKLRPSWSNYASTMRHKQKDV